MRRVFASAMLAVTCWLPGWSGVALGDVHFQQLDISLIGFDPGIPEDTREQKSRHIYPEVRRAEASYLPYVLRQTLVQSDNWGVVRVVPQTDASAELLLSGTILRSDGINLEIALRAVDCTGREWLSKTYVATSSQRDFSKTRDRSKPMFAALFQQIEHDLLERANGLGAKEIERIEQISQLLYARSLVPDAFADYLEENAEGEWELRRLPAANDPLIASIMRVREREYLFVDTVDEQYAELFDEMTPSYDLWRQFSREQILDQNLQAKRLKQREERRRDEYETLREAYNAYKWSKIEQQEEAMLATGFDNELSPTMLTLDGQIIALEGSLQDRYGEWRNILQRMFQLERGNTGDIRQTRPANIN